MSCECTYWSLVGNADHLGMCDCSLPACSAAALSHVRTLISDSLLLCCTVPADYQPGGTGGGLCGGSDNRTDAPQCVAAVMGEPDHGCSGCSRCAPPSWLPSSSTLPSNIRLCFCQCCAMLETLHCCALPCFALPCLCLLPPLPCLALPCSSKYYC